MATRQVVERTAASETEAKTLSRERPADRRSPIDRVVILRILVASYKRLTREHETLREPLRALWHDGVIANVHPRGGGDIFSGTLQGTLRIEELNERRRPPLPQIVSQLNVRSNPGDAEVLTLSIVTKFAKGNREEPIAGSHPLTVRHASQAITAVACFTD